MHFFLSKESQQLWAFLKLRNWVAVEQIISDYQTQAAALSRSCNTWLETFWNVEICEVPLLAALRMRAPEITILSLLKADPSVARLLDPDGAHNVKEMLGIHGYSKSLIEVLRAASW